MTRTHSTVYDVCESCAEARDEAIKRYNEEVERKHLVHLARLFDAGAGVSRFISTSMESGMFRKKFAYNELQPAIPLKEIAEDLITRPDTYGGVIRSSIDYSPVHVRSRPDVRTGSGTTSDIGVTRTGELVPMLYPTADRNGMYKGRKAVHVPELSEPNTGLGINGDKQRLQQLPWRIEQECGRRGLPIEHLGKSPPPPQPLRD